ncbi:MAG: hypothetical protein Kow0096_00530 [Thiohalomonadaceae bacterium]
MISWVLSLGWLAATVPALAEEAAAPAQPQWEVARAIVTSGISEREPVDELSQVAGESTKVYFFTELRGMQGQRVLHRWVHKDTVMAEVGFDVNGPRWRVWSSKNMMPDWQGTWQISVVDGNGEVLVSREFTYGQ